MTARIAALTTRLLRLPLIRPWGPDVPDIGVIETRVTDDEGRTGSGFSWTPSIGATAVRAMLDDDIAPFVVGRPAEPEGWDDVWRDLHEAGGGGVTTIALAGLDTALWDLRARRAGLGLAELLGRRHRALRVYGSGVNLHYPLPELEAQVRRWVDAGLDAVKIKVGRPDLAEDVDRVGAVRAILGPDRELMLDANQRWDLAAAVRGAEALTPFAPSWLEEPLRADDLAGHVELRRHTAVPIAVGENLHTEHRFREYLDAGAADVLQPNVVRVGGITPFLRIASLVRQRGARLAPHLLPELSAQVAFALPEATRIEDVEDARFEQLGVLAEPTGLVFGDGEVSGGPQRGLGIRFARPAAA